MLFERFNPLLRTISKCLRIFPSFFCRFIWEVISPFSGYFFLSLRYCLLASRARIGKNVYIGTHVIIKNWSNFVCGDNLSIHDFCYIDAVGIIEIGNNVSIAHGSSLISFNHTFEDLSFPIKYNQVVYEKIKIHDDVWIGCGVRVLCGVEIEERCVVAAGAVVNKSVPKHNLVGGVPAKLIKEI
ncbi:acyltransferase [Sphingobacterium sp. DK4209]|uniref:Acyltransferase n=2 Tax=Sphingobacterium zhuxiongii TaxID=2662364 RepID=A0A5Q0QDK7_9SPHI|nr:acyltransferase [Sphingobacterium sp. DK4209]QGA28297.1 acyltransferase [Sphingobacterium sp. dk4302]